MVITKPCISVTCVAFSRCCGSLTFWSGVLVLEVEGFLERAEFCGVLDVGPLN